jgi:undecaprenyl-diphosphatase
VAVLVAHGRVQEVDESLVASLRKPDAPSEPRGPAWLRGTARDLTALGSAPILVLFVLAACGALAIRRQYHGLGLLLAASATGRLLELLLKTVYDRPRPSDVYHLTPAHNPAFPSGHAMDSAIVYLTAAAILARLVQPRGLRIYLVALAAFLSLLAGVSRVYLGVHYPTDVLAGWTFGLAWAVLCWTVARRLQERGALERPK